jgi:hypothetical protein
LQAQLRDALSAKRSFQRFLRERRNRHDCWVYPSYLGLLVNSLGWGLAFRSGVGVLLTALSIPPLLARIRAEEMLLRTQFGADYDAYRARTSRLIPGLY